MELGIGRGAIAHRVAEGRLHRLYRGVYAVGHPTVPGDGRLMAAVLACGEGALASHRNAGAHWGIAPYHGARIDVTTTARGRTGPAGVTVHRVRALHPEDRAVREGIPVTSVARTLLDLAEIVSPRRLERAFEGAERLRVLDAAAVQRLLERSRGRRGLRALRALLAAYCGEVPETRSPLERRFLDFCREAVSRPRR
jgi:predicted transcriptional regulator of viral defense system